MRWLIRQMPDMHAHPTISATEDGVPIRVFRPAESAGRLPGLLWMHGGGMVMGTAAQEDSLCRLFADRLGIAVVSVDYRLAPEHPYPIPLEDCYSGLRWLATQSDVDTDRMAIGGASAGGGLAASLAILARDRGEFAPVLQLLVYPMLDDRTAARTDIDSRRLRMWNQASNRFGWDSYLGAAADGEVPPLAAPARFDDLTGLPPAWIGVGTNDLFHDEDLAYARRLRQADIPCALEVITGAYHGFDRTEAKAPVVRTFTEAQITALGAALNR